MFEAFGGFSLFNWVFRGKMPGQDAKEALDGSGMSNEQWVSPEEMAKRTSQWDEKHPPHGPFAVRDPETGEYIEDSEFGGSHFMGTGTYTANTPAQARALYSQLPQGSHAEQQALEAESRRTNPELWGGRGSGSSEPESYGSKYE